MMGRGEDAVVRQDDDATAKPHANEQPQDAAVVEDGGKDCLEYGSKPNHAY